MSTFFTYCCVIEEPPCTSPVQDVGAHRAADGALDVDAAVLVEPGVLTGDRGILHVLADRVPGDLLAVLVEERGEVRLRAVGLGRVDVGLLGELADVEVAGKVLEHGDAVVRGHAGHRECRGHRSGDENAGESAHADEAEDPGADVAHRTFLGRHIVELNGEGWQNPLCVAGAAIAPTRRLRSDRSPDRSTQSHTSETRNPHAGLGVHHHTAAHPQHRGHPEQLGLRGLGARADRAGTRGRARRIPEAAGRRRVLRRRPPPAPPPPQWRPSSSRERPDGAPRPASPSSASSCPRSRRPSRPTSPPS